MLETYFVPHRINHEVEDLLVSFRFHPLYHWYFYGNYDEIVGVGCRYFGCGFGPRSGLGGLQAGI